MSRGWEVGWELTVDDEDIYVTCRKCMKCIDRVGKAGSGLGR